MAPIQIFEAHERKLIALFLHARRCSQIAPRPAKARQNQATSRYEWRTKWWYYGGLLVELHLESKQIKPQPKAMGSAIKRCQESKDKCDGRQYQHKDALPMAANCWLGGGDCWGRGLVKNKIQALIITVLLGGFLLLAKAPFLSKGFTFLGLSVLISQLLPVK